MNLSQRDRRALAYLAVGVILTLAIRFWPESSPDVVEPGGNSATVSENRLARMRAAAATVPAKEEIAKKVRADLAQRERGILNADTAPKAQAQLMQVLRRLANDEKAEIRATELGPIKPLGDDYGEVSVSVQFDCRMEQLVNLMAALQTQRELIASSDLRIVSGNAKDKTVGVRLTVSGVVPKKLIPQKPKGAA